MIPSLSIFGMACSALLAIGFPVVLLVFWHKKTHASYAAAGVGALMFLVFAMVLEQLLHTVVLRPDGFVANTTWAYVLYGALAAGVFEETGRFVGFRFLMKREPQRAAGVMYGIGHGGIEAVLVGGTAAISNLLFAIQYNAGALAGSAPYDTAAQTIASTAPGLFFVSGIERIIAVCLHIALSVLVFTAVNRAGRLWLYPLAILLHAGVDVFAALYQRGLLTSVWLVELFVALATAAVAAYARRVYLADRDPVPEPAAVPAAADAPAEAPDAGDDTEKGSGSGRID